MTAPRCQPSIVDTLRDMRTPLAVQAAEVIEQYRSDSVHDEQVIASLKARIEELEGALRFIADGYDNHDVNHVDYRVKVYQVALDVLNPKGAT